MSKISINSINSINNSRQTILQKLVSLFPKREWDLEALSENLNYNPNFVRVYKDKNIEEWQNRIDSNYYKEFEKSDLNFLLHNEQNNLVLIINLYDWSNISNDEDITMDLVNKYPNSPWVWEFLSGNPGVTMENIQNNIDKPWVYDAISGNPNITVKFIKDNLLNEWNWFEISRNPNITMKDFLDNISLPWDLDGISNNPNLTVDIVIDNSHIHWNFDWVSCNKFKYNKELRELHERKIKKSKLRGFNMKNWYLLNLVIKHPSQKFYKWYCGEGGIGRRIDNQRQINGLYK